MLGFGSVSLAEVEGHLESADLCQGQMPYCAMLTELFFLGPCYTPPPNFMKIVQIVICIIQLTNKTKQKHNLLGLDNDDDDNDNNNKHYIFDCSITRYLVIADCC